MDQCASSGGKIVVRTDYDNMVDYDSMVAIVIGIENHSNHALWCVVLPSVCIKEK